MQSGVAHPTCKAILLCDQTILEAGTNKVSLIGIFQNFGLETIPGETKKIEAFCQLTNAEGEYQLRAEIHDLQKDEVLARSEGLPPLTIPNRLLTANIIVPIPPLPIQHEGKFDFVLFANDAEVDRQTFSVAKI